MIPDAYLKPLVRGGVPIVAPLRVEQLWNYRSLVDAFRGYPSRIALEHERIVAEIEVAAFDR